MIDNIISSQNYINDEIVEEKIAAGDFEIQVSPEFEVEGEIYRVLLDGHHSLAAAISAGVEPIIIEHSVQDNDRILILEAGDIDGFLMACHMGSDYAFAVSGRSVW